MRSKTSYALIVLAVVVLSVALGSSLLSHPANAMRLFQATGTAMTTPAGTSTVSTTPTGTATSIPLAAYPVYASPYQNLPHRTIAATQTAGEYSFKPSSLHIKTGTVVIWRNTGHRALTLVSSKNGWTFQVRLAPGKSNEYLFTKSGSYQYHTTGHHRLSGRILVRSK